MGPRSIVGLGALLLFALGCRDDASSPTEPVAGIPQGAPALAVGSNTWLTRRDMPYARWGMASAVVTNSAGQSILYAIGGTTATGASLSRVQAYNVATNTWSWKAPLPIPLKWTNGAGVIDGKIYLAGGITHVSTGDAFNYHLYVYNPATNAWTRKRDMPFTGFKGFTGVINNKLYVVTSCGDREACRVPGQWLLRYDPLLDTWTELATPPRGYYHGIGSIISLKFFLGSQLSNRLDVYDPLTNTWTLRKTNLAIRQFPASVMLGAKLYMMGGLGRNTAGAFTVRTTNVYDPGTSLWTNRAPMPRAGSDLAAARVFVDGRARIEVVGGAPPGNNVQYIP